MTTDMVPRVSLLPPWFRKPGSAPMSSSPFSVSPPSSGHTTLCRKPTARRSRKWTKSLGITAAPTRWPRRASSCPRPYEKDSNPSRAQLQAPAPEKQPNRSKDDALPSLLATLAPSLQFRPQAARSYAFQALEQICQSIIAGWSCKVTSTWGFLIFIFCLLFFGFRAGAEEGEPRKRYQARLSMAFIDLIFFILCLPPPQMYASMSIRTGQS